METTRFLLPPDEVYARLEKELAEVLEEGFNTFHLIELMYEVKTQFIDTDLVLVEQMYEDAPLTLVAHNPSTMRTMQWFKRGVLYCSDEAFKSMVKGNV